MSEQAYLLAKSMSPGKRAGLEAAARRLPLTRQRRVRRGYARDVLFLHDAAQSRDPAMVEGNRLIRRGVLRLVQA